MLVHDPRLPIGHLVTMGALPSPVKKFIYRRLGYKIGKGVSIGFGSVVVGKDVEIGDHTDIGFASIVRGDRIRLDRHVSIGALCVMDVPNLELGEGTRATEMVIVGGPKLPESSLKVGKNCILMQMSFIDPTLPIEIGDDSGVGGHCLLFTHGSWLSRFEGYPVTFAPITIGDSVWLPWRVFVMPGATIGDGSVIGADSLVAGEIPPQSLAVGSPAKVIRSAPDFPRRLDDTKKNKVLDEILDGMDQHLLAHGVKVERVGTRGTYKVRKKRRLGMFKRFDLRIRRLGDPGLEPGETPAVFVSLPEIPGPERARLDAAGTMWIDIAKKERSERSDDLGEEIVERLVLYGVRLTRAR